MKARTKTKLYLALAIAGIVLVVVSNLVFHNVWNRTQSGAAVGIGAGLFGFGLAKYWFGRWEEKDPERIKLNAIEVKDERNQLIRSKAQAVSGEILHWLLMGGAWVSIFLDTPLWVTLSFVGVFLLKTVLDFVLMAYYQRKM